MTEPRAGSLRTRADDPTSVEVMEPNYDRHPAFERCPSASEIAYWFVAEKRGKENVGGDAWWLSRDPHSSCRMLAFVDWDVQEFWLLDIATGDSKDLLWVTNGLDGTWCEWWQHPISTSSSEDYPYWETDGIKWMADQIVVHLEGQTHGR